MRHHTLRFIASTGAIVASTTLSAMLLTSAASAATIHTGSLNKIRTKHVIAGVGVEGSVREEGSETTVQQNGENEAPLVHGGRTSGTVTALNGSGFTITVYAPGKTAKNAIAATSAKYTVTTNAATIFLKGGVKATLADVVVGERIVITGTVNKLALTVAANKITIVTTLSIKGKANGKNHIKNHSKKTISTAPTTNG